MEVLSSVSSMEICSNKGRCCAGGSDSNTSFDGTLKSAGRRCVRLDSPNSRSVVLTPIAGNANHVPIERSAKLSAAPDGPKCMGIDAGNRSNTTIAIVIQEIIRATFSRTKNRRGADIESSRRLAELLDANNANGRE